MISCGLCAASTIFFIISLLTTLHIPLKKVEEINSNCVCVREEKDENIILEECTSDEIFEKSFNIKWCCANGVMPKSRFNDNPNAKYMLTLECNYDLYPKQKTEKAKSDISQKIMEQKQMKHRLEKDISSLMLNHKKYKKAHR